MLHLLLLCCLWRTPFAGGTTPASCVPAADQPAGAVIDHANERYTDFMRLRRADEYRTRTREANSVGVRDATRARERTLELARREYASHRRPKVDTTAADEQWEKIRKDRLAQNEAARRCFVQQQQSAARALGRGRQIPANAEFGLDE